MFYYSHWLICAFHWILREYLNILDETPSWSPFGIITVSFQQNGFQSVEGGVPFDLGPNTWQKVLKTIDIKKGTGIGEIENEVTTVRL